MIVKKLSNCSTGRFPGASYNETKVLEGVAELLLASNIDSVFIRRLDILHAVGISASSDVERYLVSHSRTFGNSRTQNKQFHVALSVKGQEMNKYELRDFAERFMQQIGYGQQPYFVYFHHDTDNNHVHILSTRIDPYGRAISDSYDKLRMSKAMNDLLGINAEQAREKMFSYSYQTEGQFLNVAKSCGYSPKAEVVNGEAGYTFFRDGMPQFSVPLSVIMSKAARKDDMLDKKTREERARQLKAILTKYRQQSLSLEMPRRKRAQRKADLQDMKTNAYQGLRHKDGTPLTEQEVYQMKWFVGEVKSKFGIDIHWQRDKNGVVRGYGIVDHKQKMAFDGSKVFKLTDLLDMNLKSEQAKEKVQSVNSATYGVNGSVSVAKHRNGRFYLRVSLQHSPTTETVFLDVADQRAYMQARDATTKEQLRQNFIQKYLLGKNGGSGDYNREWEVGHGSYEVDDEGKLKR